VKEVTTEIGGIKYTLPEAEKIYDEMVERAKQDPNTPRESPFYRHRQKRVNRGIR